MLTTMSITSLEQGATFSAQRYTTAPIEDASTLPTAECKPAKAGLLARAKFWIWTFTLPLSTRPAN